MTDRVPPATVLVAAGVIRREGRLLITRRLEGTHLSGLWEFPGGKVEPGESPAEGLRRELLEELGVLASVGHQMMVIEHRYPEKTVRLHFHACEIAGEPEARLGQEMAWVHPRDLPRYQFPDADRELVMRLALTPPAP
ncbi:MAG: 8-oxo-dGTP diphosphatase MutT [Vicinamibacterales bacterium]